MKLNQNRERLSAILNGTSFDEGLIRQILSRPGTHHVPCSSDNFCFITGKPALDAVREAKSYGYAFVYTTNESMTLKEWQEGNYLPEDIEDKFARMRELEKEISEREGISESELPNWLVDQVIGNPTLKIY